MTEQKPKVPELFKRTSFISHDLPYYQIDLDFAVEKAQQIFASWLESQTVVYGVPNVPGEQGTYWFKDKQHSKDSHIAYLVSPTPIKREPCEHGPSINSTIYGSGKRMVSTCKHCGAKLVAEWKEVSE